MTPREGIQAAIQHRETDLLPVDCGGGFVFNTIHNIVASTPIGNGLAMINVIHEYKK